MVGLRLPFASYRMRGSGWTFPEGMEALVTIEEIVEREVAKVTSSRRGACKHRGTAYDTFCWECVNSLGHAVAKATAEECAKITEHCECARSGCSCEGHAADIRALSAPRPEGSET